MYALCHGMGSNDFQSTDLLFFDQCYRICTYLWWMCDPYLCACIFGGFEFKNSSVIAPFLNLPFMICRFIETVVTTFICINNSTYLPFPFAVLCEIANRNAFDGMRLLCQLSGQHRRKKGVPLYQSFWHYFRVGLINWRIKLSKDTDKTAYRDVTLSTPFISPHGFVSLREQD